MGVKSGPDKVRQIRLIGVNTAVVDLLRDVEMFRRCFNADASANPDRVRDLARQNAEFQQRVEFTPPWTGYLTVDAETQAIVGCCAFTGNPTAEGEVEIAYHTLPSFEGRGFATAMAGELTRIARSSGQAKTVIAHTLPEPNASTRILEKTGFLCDGEIVHPEDGRIWRWRRSAAQPTA